MIFNKEEQQWKDLNAYWTSKEIHQQPATWEKTLKQVKDEGEAIQAFIKRTTDKPDYDIILTGAGTSEFVGNAIYSYLAKKNHYKVKSYGTTDIVACPENYLCADKPTLLISFGRSGNSPESVAAVEVANEVCGDNIEHLFVTCNHEGALSKFAVGKENCYAINLTPETHDQSFAMTSSFSNMYLATIAAFNLDRYDEFCNEVKTIIERGSAFVEENYTKAADIVSAYDFKRIVYLGSNTGKGVSQESALKMCELTAGKIVTMYDTPMGFRHGPKSIIDDTTLTVVYMSDDPYTRQYERDIVREMAPQRKGNKILVVTGQPDEEMEKLSDFYICFDNGKDLPNVLLGLEYILVAQVIAIFKSMSMGITPDNPCPSGEVNRVVKGVIIYPYKKESK